MNIKKKAFIVIILFVIIAFWFIGWKSTRYDDKDKEIGKIILFSSPMVILKNIPEKYAGDHIANNYATLLTTEASRKNFEPWFPHIPYEEVNCNEEFLVKNVFYNENHGFLTKGFSPDIKYFVLSSSNHGITVINSDYYEGYTVNSHTNNDGCITKYIKD